MKVNEISFFQWQTQFHNEETCHEYLKQLKWSNGFICPRCGHDHAYVMEEMGSVSLYYKQVFF